MEIRRENYEAFASQALVAALNSELLDRYEGIDGSGGEQVAADFEPPGGAEIAHHRLADPALAAPGLVNVAADREPRPLLLNCCE